MRGEDKDMNAESDLPLLTAIFAAVVAAIVVAFLVIAAISPNVSIDIPGVSGCRNGACGPGGAD